MKVKSLLTSAALRGLLQKALQEKQTLFDSLSEKAGDLDLPTLADCAAHLELLNAFSFLKSQVARSGWAKASGLGADGAWQRYVQLAAARFTTWSRAVTESQMKVAIPPLGKNLLS